MMYQIMVQTRIAIIVNAAVTLHRGAQIATRYAVCRRQFKSIKESQQERKLLDYTLHMDTLAQHLCRAITLELTVREVSELDLQS